ncbi:MAG: AMP-binding protein [Magnetococcales bacterium]|nr:AMP-binding protein [Magnetococcales bacterium]
MSLKQKLIGLFMRLIFRLHCRDANNLTNNRQGCLVICNHQAKIDLPILASLLPANSRFIVANSVFPSAFFRWLFSWVEFISYEDMIDQDWIPVKDHLNSGGLAAFFPELIPSNNGSFAKIAETPIKTLQQISAGIIPCYLSGSQYHNSSNREKSLPRYFFPKISVTILPVQPPGELFYDLLGTALVAHFQGQGSLWGALCRVGRIYGHTHRVVSDSTGVELTYRQIYMRSLILGRLVAKITKPGRLVGVLMPTSAGGLLTFFCLHAFGRIPALLNFTSGAKLLLSACKTGEIETVLTSRTFVEKAGLTTMVEQLSRGVNVVYLEELRPQISLKDKLLGLLGSFWPERRVNHNSAKADDTAVVLFTSGSEGDPKGVALSHDNILSNLQQIRARIALNSDDKFLNVLPIFHAFGLTVGTLAPLLAGVRCHYHPSPLDYKKIPELANQLKVTILAGTNTFLSGYGRNAEPHDFQTLRVVVAGAEVLREETRVYWFDKFGIKIFEGYGATEASPVLAVNCEVFNQATTVGRFLPGIEYKLMPVMGIKEGGLLLVKGSNIMQGYLQIGGGCIPVMPKNELGPEWYNSGDVVVVDELGFVKIVGRVKRFAKIGGEMVSLAGLESIAATVWPDHQHAVVAQPDAKKGESLYLATTKQGAAKNDLLSHINSIGLSKLYIPSQIIYLDEIPMNGVGKIDYAAITVQIGDNNKP